ncbi:hypothetical protein Tco_1406778 [Tanacetum coccineum]
MAVEDTPPPPLSSHIDKIIPFSIPNKVPIKLDLEKHNYNSWSSFSLIHLGSLRLKAHVETNTASTNPEWCQLDDLIKMWILGSLSDSLQEQVVTTPVSEKNLVIYAVNGLDSRFATLVEIIRHREPLPTFEIVRNMLLLKESSFTDSTDASTMLESSSSSLTILLASSSSDAKARAISIQLPSRQLFQLLLSLLVPLLGTNASVTPGDEVLRSLSSRQFISCNKAKSTHVCHACQLAATTVGIPASIRRLPKNLLDRVSQLR